MQSFSSVQSQRVEGKVEQCMRFVAVECNCSGGIGYPPAGLLWTYICCSFWIRSGDDSSWQTPMNVCGRTGTVLQLIVTGDPFDLAGLKVTAHSEREVGHKRGGVNWENSIGYGGGGQALLRIFSAWQAARNSLGVIAACPGRGPRRGKRVTLNSPEEIAAFSSAVVIGWTCELREF